jgi:hypothetical protein
MKLRRLVRLEDDLNDRGRFEIVGSDPFEQPVVDQRQ